MSSAYNGFVVFTGTRYIYGYIGDDDSKSDWLKNRTKRWERKIRAVAKTAGKYPQEIYYAMARRIQSE